MSNKKLVAVLAALAIVVGGAVLLFQIDSGTAKLDNQASECSYIGKEPSLNPKGGAGVSSAPVAAEQPDKPSGTSTLDEVSITDDTDDEDPITDEEQKLFDSLDIADGFQTNFRKYTMAENKEELRKLLLSMFGQIPDNPIAELSKFDDDAIRAMMLDENSDDLEFEDITTLGLLLPQVYELDQILGWFEGFERKLGIEGEATAEMLRWIVEDDYVEEKLQKDPALRRRTVAVLDSYFAASRGKAVSYIFLARIRNTLKLLCPSPEALELIRRWIVEKPHGHESLETSIVEYLGLWPLSEVGTVVLEVLGTGGAGAVKGIIHAWRKSGRDDSFSWSKEEATQFLEQPLTQTVMETKSVAAIYMAANFAVDGLLSPQASQIADSLFSRVDTQPYVADMGFTFLKHVDQQAASVKWQEWFYSDDNNKVEAACYVALEFSGTAKKAEVLDRLFEFASAKAEPSSFEAAAAKALFELEDGVTRSYAILEGWLELPKLSRSALISASRMLIRGPEETAKALLIKVIDDPNRSPEQRYTAMFLLGCMSYSTAISICEDPQYAGKFTDLTVLVVAALAEMMGNHSYLERGRKLRQGISTPEPEWIRIIRLDLATPKSGPEQSVAGWAYIVG
ncbi:MAG: hypothetical protein V3V10_09075 [Planctomycetota bacterium]